MSSRTARGTALAACSRAPSQGIPGSCSRSRVPAGDGGGGACATPRETRGPGAGDPTRHDPTHCDRPRTAGDQRVRAKPGRLTSLLDRLGTRRPSRSRTSSGALCMRAPEGHARASCVDHARVPRWCTALSPGRRVVVQGACEMPRAPGTCSATRNSSSSTASSNLTSLYQAIYGVGPSRFFLDIG